MLGLVSVYYWLTKVGGDIKLGGSHGSVKVISIVVVSVTRPLDLSTVPVISMMYVPGVILPDS